jgi:hypothetical protein
MAERTGRFLSTPPSPSTTAQATYDSIKREYRDLFWQREAIQARMRIIEEELGKEGYEALIREIENPQLAKLKHLGPLDSARGQQQ